MIFSMSLTAAKRCKVNKITGTPFKRRYCLGVLDPMRRPTPAAGKIAQIVIVKSSESYGY